MDIECTYIQVLEPEFSSNLGLATRLLYTYSTHVADLHEMDISLEIDNVSSIIFQLQMTSILLSGCLWEVRRSWKRINVFLLYGYLK